jgi:DNA repair protein RadC
MIDIIRIGQREGEKCMNVRKRVQLVSLKMIKESSFLYEPRKISLPSDGVKMAEMFLKEKDREELLVVLIDLMKM